MKSGQVVIQKKPLQPTSNLLVILGHSSVIKGENGFPSFKATSPTFIQFISWQNVKTLLYIKLVNYNYKDSVT